MATKSDKSRKRRTGLIVALCALMCVALVGGVYAWYSTTDDVMNTFVQGGNINDPEKNPDPIDPTKPSTDDDQNTTFKGNIQETLWVDSSKISADGYVLKNPNVGVGKGSDSSYVFVKVENNLPTGSYFILGSNWEAVDATEYTVSDTNPKSSADTDTEDTTKRYTSGIFVYTGGQTGDTLAKRAKVLESPTTADVYTGEIFHQIYTSSKFTSNSVTGSANTVNVKAYFGAKSNSSETLDYSTIETAAKTKLNDTTWVASARQAKSS